MKSAVLSWGALALGALLVAAGLWSLEQRVVAPAALTTPDLEAERERYQSERAERLARANEAAEAERRALEEEAAQHRSEIAASKAARDQVRRQQELAQAAQQEVASQGQRVGAAAVKAQAELATRKRELEEAQRARPQSIAALGIAKKDEADSRAQLMSLSAQTSTLLQQRRQQERRLQLAKVMKSGLDLKVDSIKPEDTKKLAGALKNIDGARTEILKLDVQRAVIEKQRAAAAETLDTRAQTVKSLQVVADTTELVKKVKNAEVASDKLQQDERAAQQRAEQSQRDLARATQDAQAAEAAFKRVLSSDPANARIEAQDELARAVDGVADYSKPSRMTLNQESDLSLTLRRNTQGADGSGPFVNGPVGHAKVEQLTAMAEVMLDGNPADFGIRPLDTDKQAVEQKGTTWHWRVVPLRPGAALRLTYLVRTFAPGIEVARNLPPQEISFVVEAGRVTSEPWYAALWRSIAETTGKEFTLLFTGAIVSCFGVLRLQLWSATQRLWYFVRDRRRAKRVSSKGAVELHVLSQHGRSATVSAELCDLSVDVSGVALLVAAGAIAPVVGAAVRIDQPSGDPLQGVVKNVSMNGQRSRVGIALTSVSA